jgi:DNA-3-methyladenine glycosylase
MTVERESLAKPALEVAPLLLGAVLVSTVDGAEVAVRLTEVEAYEGLADPASHAYRGRTRRNDVMFGPAGYLYCYFTYGMHWCANVVCGPEDSPSAVLLRAGEVVDGLAVARSRRPAARLDRDLARGPARLCQALGIDVTANGHDLSCPPLTLTLAEDAAAQVETGPRVGLRQAADRPWRFWLPGEPSVSTYRPATTRPRRRPPTT